MIHIYRRQSSTGARQLSIAVGGNRLFRINDPKLKAGDSLVCWGERQGQLPDIKVLNGAPFRTKYEDAIRLKEENVPTITVSLQRGFAAEPGRHVIDPRVGAYAAVREGAQVIAGRNWADDKLYMDILAEHRQNIEKFEKALRAGAPPPVPRVEWLPRMNDHVGGADLLHPPAHADYYSKKESLVKEYRVHSFMGRSLRAGIKRVRDGVANPHPWIRSWDGGWQMSYDGHSSTKAHRELAHRAIKALGLDFGAVDIGERADGSLLVLEVNRAPGLEGGTVTCYADAVREWAGQQVGRRVAPKRRAA